jgi:predicted enzyme related to lactoylglutathione lyase
MESAEKDWARPVVHWEIRARDPEAQRAFYAAMFNWDISDGRMKNIPAGIGGPEPGPGGHIAPADEPGVSIYVQVLNLRASLDRAAELGGSIVSQPRDLPNGPTIAMITDPEGNRLTLVQQ